jgi:hypothetical protein
LFVTILWTLVGAAAGGMIGGALGDLGANHAGDIGRIFGGVVVGALAGAVCGGFAGRALDRKFSGDPRQRKRLVIATCLTPLVLVLGGVLFETVRSFDYLLPSHGAAWVSYEVRLPPGTTAPDEKAVVAEFRTEKETRKQSFPGHDLDVERVGDRVVIKGSFESYRTAKQRTLLLRIGGGPTYNFNLQLPARPPSGYAKDWSGNWHGAAQVEEAGKTPRPPQPNETLEIRYKMDL